MNNNSIFDFNGKRKYLSKMEVNQFLIAASHASEDIYLFCALMVFTGCRISEALELTCNSFDPDLKCVVIRCLKKRRVTIYRTVPLPSDLFDKLWAFSHRQRLKSQRLWPYSRMTAYRKVIAIMNAAQIQGAHATPKGLRHSFGVNAIQAGVPINLVQRWLGHADIKTTAIYANALGPEERNIATRMWA